jgi:hypothetical protein
LLYSDTVQRWLRIFYAIFDARVESNLNATSFHEFARLAFAVEWTLVPAHILFFLPIFKRGGSFSRLAAMPLWKSFFLMNVVGLASLAVYAQPLFEPPLRSPDPLDSIDTYVTRLAYSGKFGFLLVFSAMGWAIGVMVAAMLGYWRWVIYPRFFRDKDDTV